MTYEELDARIHRLIDSFPQQHRSLILDLWSKWTATSPEPPFYLSWSKFASQTDDASMLYDENRIYVRRITNEIRDMEVPKTAWQKVAKALAAVASAFFVFIMALSRAARAAD
jgi:hypothetical protein